MMAEEFTAELSALINRYSLENGSNTPDFLLALYLTECLTTWNKAVRAREQWYGREPSAVSAPSTEPTAHLGPETPPGSASSSESQATEAAPQQDRCCSTSKTETSTS